MSSHSTVTRRHSALPPPLLPTRRLTAHDAYTPTMRLMCVCVCVRLAPPPQAIQHQLSNERSADPTTLRPATPLTRR